jgi:hypothetical protein
MFPHTFTACSSSGALNSATVTEWRNCRRRNRRLKAGKMWIDVYAAGLDHRRSRLMGGFRSAAGGGGGDGLAAVPRGGPE